LREAVSSSGALTAELDGKLVENIPFPDCKDTSDFSLAREGDSWKYSHGCGERHEFKGALCSGPFKQAFKNEFILVSRTKGTPEENAWALAKARYDAETFWYRGNGSVDIVADTDLTSIDLKSYGGAERDPSMGPMPPDLPRHRNAILYGNQDTNGAWGEV